MGVLLKTYCRNITVNKPDLLKIKGPVLVAFNHPNSFMDAMIIDILFDEPLWSLARGDAFRNKRAAKFLHQLRIMPMFRSSEGVENLTENYKTFDACLQIFREGGGVQIFSEGLCVNEWHLRPLRKGTARLATRAWDEKIPLKVLPLGINYSSFEGSGKDVVINIGEFITVNDIDLSASDGARNQAFNALLRKQLEQLVYEIDPNDKAKRAALLVKKTSVFKKILLFIPAVAGYLLTAPLYLPLKNFARKKTKGTVHYDSVMVGLLFILYPVYLLLLVLIGWLIFKTPWMWTGLLLIPFTAWCYVQVREKV